MNSWMWLLGGLVLLAAELLTPGGFYLIFFGAGALAVGLITLLAPVPLALQFAIFGALSLAALALFRKKIISLMNRPAGSVAVDTLVGSEAVALDEIAGHGMGKAELRGAAWTARNVGPSPIGRSERCIVEQVDGLMLLVRGR